MTGRTGADLDGIHEVRRLLGRRADDVDDVVGAVRHGLDWFRSTSTEYVPSLPPHHVRGADLAARLDRLGHDVAAVRDAMVAADRWVGTSVALWLDGRLGEHATAVDGRHATVEVWSRWRRSVLAGEDVAFLGHRSFLVDDAGDHFAGAAWRQQWADTVADGRHVLGRGTTPLPGAGAAGRLGRAVERFGASRAGAVTRIGGRALGVAGVAMGGVDVVQGWREGDEERMATGALGTAAGIAVMSGFPPAQLAGAVVAGGLLVYEYREELADGARAVGRAATGAARAAADFVKGLF